MVKQSENIKNTIKSILKKDDQQVNSTGKSVKFSNFVEVRKCAIKPKMHVLKKSTVKPIEKAKCREIAELLNFADVKSKTQFYNKYIIKQVD